MTIITGMKNEIQKLVIAVVILLSNVRLNRGEKAAQEAQMRNKPDFVEMSH